MSHRKTITENYSQLHLEEVSMVCPLCKKSLLNFGVSKTNKDFQIAHIYPCNPTSSDLIILSEVEQPKDTESFDNKIALCKDCHWDYDSNKTLEKYTNLISLKKQLIADFTNKRNLLLISLEEDIGDVIRKIASLDYSTLDENVTNSYSAFMIDRKIDSKYNILRQQIKTNVSMYFCIIRGEFQNLDKNGMRRFDQISNQMKNAYLKTLEKEKNQEIIYELLVNWLATKTEADRSVCQVIISFFIQNCEIYDEIT